MRKKSLRILLSCICFLALSCSAITTPANATSEEDYYSLYKQTSWENPVDLDNATYDSTVLYDTISTKDGGYLTIGNYYATDLVDIDDEEASVKHLNGNILRKYTADDELEWETEWGQCGNDNDGYVCSPFGGRFSVLSAVAQTEDEGFIVLGATTWDPDSITELAKPNFDNILETRALEFANSESNPILVKFDKNGDREWTKYLLYEDSFNSESVFWNDLRAAINAEFENVALFSDLESTDIKFTNIIASRNGGYYAIGMISPGFSNDDGWHNSIGASNVGMIVKLNEDGEYEKMALYNINTLIAEEQSYTSANKTFFMDAMETEDGDLIVSGFHMKMNFRFMSAEILSDVSPIGYYSFDNVGQYALITELNGILVRYDSDLTKQWSVDSIDDFTLSGLTSVKELSDGRIAVGGVASSSFPLKSYVAVYSDDGVMEWGQTHTKADYTSSITSDILENQDGDLVAITTSIENADIFDVIDVIHGAIYLIMHPGNAYNVDSLEGILDDYLKFDTEIVVYDMDDGEEISVTEQEGVNFKATEKANKDLVTVGINTRNISVEFDPTTIEARTSVFHKVTPVVEEEEEEIKVPDTGLFTGVGGTVAKVVTVAILGFIAIISVVSAHVALRAHNRRNGMSFKK